MAGVVTGFAVIVGLIAAGYLSGAWPGLPPSAGEVLTYFSLNLATPALLVTTLGSTSLSGVFTTLMAATAVSTTVVAISYALVARLVWRPTVSEGAVGVMAASYVNSTYLGIPIATYVLRDAAWAAPGIVFQMVLLGPVVVTVIEHGHREGRRGGRGPLWASLTNPLALGALLGVLVSLSGWQMPEMITRPLEALGGMAVPAVLLAFGLSLRGAPAPWRSAERGHLAVIVVLRCVLHPLVAAVVAGGLLGARGLALAACVVTAALPTGQNVFMVASFYRTAISLARDAVVATTVVSLPLIGVLAAVLT